MKISTEELGELLVAIGTVLKSGPAADTEPQTVEATEVPTATETGTFDDTPMVAAGPEPPAPQPSAADLRIRELEAELSKIRSNNSAVLGLQPIKLNNATINTEVSNG